MQYGCMGPRLRTPAHCSFDCLAPSTVTTPCGVSPAAPVAVVKTAQADDSPRVHAGAQGRAGRVKGDTWLQRGFGVWAVLECLSHVRSVPKVGDPVAAGMMPNAGASAVWMIKDSSCTASGVLCKQQAMMLHQQVLPLCAGRSCQLRHCCKYGMQVQSLGPC